jgi:hypothetical protein
MRGGPTCVLVVALLAAGCVAHDAPKASPASAAPNASANLSKAALPDGRAGSFAAFNETNRTEAGAGGLEHRHDYWQGRERVTIYQGHVGFFLSGGKPVTRLQLPNASLVFEGTDHLEATFANPVRRACAPLTINDVPACSDAEGAPAAPDPTGQSSIHLFARDPTASDWQDAGPVAWGQAILLPIRDPKQTDMPHSTATLWAFEVRSTDPQDATLAFDARIDIVRGSAAIPLWPGHPDLYATGHARLVLQQHVKQHDSGPLSIASGLATGTEFDAPADVPAQKLISYGTRALLVWVNGTKVSPAEPADAPTGWFLYVKNATGHSNETPDLPGNGPFHWVVPVDANGMDSPYATASRWGFHLSPVVGAANGGCYGDGCAAYDAEYDLTIVATDLDVPVPSPQPSS